MMRSHYKGKLLMKALQGNMNFIERIIFRLIWGKYEKR